MNGLPLLTAALLFLLVACKPRSEDPPPLPDTVVVPPPPLATLVPLSTPPAKLLAAQGALPPRSTARPLATAAPPARGQITFTPYTIQLPRFEPIPRLGELLSIPVLWPLPTEPSPVPTAPSTSSAPSKQAPPAASSDRVIVFGARWCGPCKSLQEDLEQRSVPFTFIDVEDAEAMKTPAGARMAEIPADKRGGIPVTRVVRRDGSIDWVSGANGARIEQVYRG